MGSGWHDRHSEHDPDGDWRHPEISIQPDHLDPLSLIQLVESPPVDPLRIPARMRGPPGSLLALDLLDCFRCDLADRPLPRQILEVRDRAAGIRADLAEAVSRGGSYGDVAILQRRDEGGDGFLRRRAHAPDGDGGA